MQRSAGDTGVRLSDQVGHTGPEDSSSIQPPGVATLRSSCAAERGDWPVRLPTGTGPPHLKGVSQEVVRLIRG